MRKFFPLVLSLSCFSIFVIFQIVSDVLISRDFNDQSMKLHEKVSAVKFQDMQGKWIKVSDVKAPIIIFNFWASWCRPCLAEFPSLVKLKRKYPDSKLRIFAINSDEKDQLRRVGKVFKDYGINFDVVLDRDGSLFETFGVTSIPHSIVFNQEKVLMVQDGFRDFEGMEFEKFISTHIN